MSVEEPDLGQQDLDGFQGLTSESLSGRRVLVVDDERDICELVAELLEDFGCRVEAQYDAQGARRRLSEGGLDAVVLDVMGVSGLELLAEFGERYPCVILTGKALNPGVLRQAIERKARAFIPKEEINNLPFFLELALSIDDLEELWAIWLWQPFDVVNLALHLGEDWREGEDGEFFRQLIARVERRTGNRVENRDGVALLTYSEPSLNEMTPSTAIQFLRILQHLAADDEIRAVVLHSGLRLGYPPGAISRSSRVLPFGLGRTMLGRFLARLLLRLRHPGIQRSRTFGVGMTVQAFKNQTMLQVCHRFAREGFLATYYFPKPFVALIEGLAAAGGFELALCAHYLMVTPQAVCSLPEFRLAFPPPCGMPLLAQRIGFQRAFALAADTRWIWGRQAVRSGIADELVKSRSALDHAIKVAGRMADRQVNRGLDVVRRSCGFDMRAAFAQGFEAWADASRTPQAQAKIDRFLETRVA